MGLFGVSYRCVFMRTRNVRRCSQYRTRPVGAPRLLRTGLPGTSLAPEMMAGKMPGLETTVDAPALRSRTEADPGRTDSLYLDQHQTMNYSERHMWQDIFDLANILAIYGV